jgi:O-antigen ligase
MNAKAILHRVRLWWTCGFTLALLLNLDGFGAVSGLGPQPKYWSIGIFAVSLALFLPVKRVKRSTHSALLWWVGGYLCYSALWVLPADDQEAALDGFVMVITTCLYVSTALLVYPLIKKSDRLWEITLWFALLIAVASVLLDYFAPSAVLFKEVGLGITGRAAGLYLNPNLAGQAILMILLCLLLRTSPRAFFVAALIALAGLLPTFSRSSVLAWAILMVGAVIFGRVPRAAIPVLVGAAIGILAAGPTVLNLLSNLFFLEDQNSLDRLTWILGQGASSDSLEGERGRAVNFGLDQFWNSPLLGHGIGFTSVWVGETGTHNLILRHLVEYGILGCLIFPMFLWYSIRPKEYRSDQRIIYLVASIALFLSFFSHNLLEQAIFILPWLSACLISFSTMPEIRPKNLGHRLSSSEVQI